MIIAWDWEVLLMLTFGAPFHWWFPPKMSAGFVMKSSVIQSTHDCICDIPLLKQVFVTGEIFVLITVCSHIRSSEYIIFSVNWLHVIIHHFSCSCALSFQKYRQINEFHETLWTNLAINWHDVYLQVENKAQIYTLEPRRMEDRTLRCSTCRIPSLFTDNG